MVNGVTISENKFICEKSLLEGENASNTPKINFEFFSLTIEVLSHDGCCVMEFSIKSNSDNAERKLSC